MISDLAGGEPKRIDVGDSAPQHPVWAMDGTTMYYTAKSHLWRVRPDGTGQEMLREMPPIIELHAGPDGKHLYYLKAGKRFTVCRIAVAGGVEEIVQEGLELPTFSVGRRAIYTVREGFKLHAQPVSGGPIESLGTVVMNDASGNAMWEARLTVSPDGSMAIWVLSVPTESDITMQNL